MEIHSERTTIGDSMGAYVARPTEGGPYPAVLVFMEIFGINEHIRDVVERVAREGYVAIAPDYFHRTGPGVEFEYDEEGMEQGMALLAQLVGKELIADARAAYQFAKSHPDTNGKVAAMGFCIGGHVTYLAACELPLDAAASFYGGGIAAASGPGGAPSTLKQTPKMKCPILCFFGAEDSMIPQEQVGRIRAALEGKEAEVVVYPGADHGFFCDRRGSYQAAAASDAWEKVKTLFAAM